MSLVEKLKTLIAECESVKSEVFNGPLTQFQMNRLYRYPAALRALSIAVEYIDWVENHSCDERFNSDCIPCTAKQVRHQIEKEFK